MTNRSKHLPYYVILGGFLLCSVGFNFIQNQEIKLLKQEKTAYRYAFEYLELKVRILEFLRDIEITKKKYLCIDNKGA